MKNKEANMKFDFPELPKSMTEIGEFDLTLEQRAFFKLSEKEELSNSETDGVKAAIEFYKIAFPYLQSIPLSTLTNEDIFTVEKYCDDIINFQIIVENDILFNFLSRVTKVKDEFLEDGKVRNLKYIVFPSIEVVKSLGLYNRASSPNHTVFYASFHENVALHETKPQANERIIITTWKNFTHKPFVSFPISNNESVKNKMLEHSTSAVKKLGTRINPLLFDLIDLYLRFLSAEFVKNENIISPKRYEYFYSAYFGDMLLNNDKITTDKIKPKNNRGKNMGDFDCILYPSVSFKHREENLAVKPTSVIENLKPIKIKEYIVEETYYDKANTVDDSPIRKKILRTVTDIKNGEKLIWSDD